MALIYHSFQKKKSLLSFQSQRSCKLGFFSYSFDSLRLICHFLKNICHQSKKSICDQLLQQQQPRPRIRAEVGKVLNNLCFLFQQKSVFFKFCWMINCNYCSILHITCHVFHQLFLNWAWELLAVTAAYWTVHIFFFTKKLALPAAKRNLFWIFFLAKNFWVSLAI